MDGDDLTCGLGSLLFGMSLLGAYGGGRLVRPRLPRHHLSREMTDLLLAVIAMLVTFSAIVLGLMLNSSLDRMQHLNGLVAQLADGIVRLDDTLVEYGQGAELARVAIESYARRERSGLAEASDAPMTRAAFQQVGGVISRLHPPDDYHTELRHDALDRYNDVADTRFRLVTEGNASPNTPFDVTLGLWLLLTYFVFGLNTDRNTFVLVALISSITAVVVAVFVIIDTGTALGGLISVSEAPLDAALRQL